MACTGSLIYVAKVLATQSCGVYVRLQGIQQLSKDHLILSRVINLPEVA